MEHKVLLLEFNELCPHLLEKYMAEGLLPNFQKLYAMGHTHQTIADEEPPNLEPWIQWVSVHTGVPFAKHKVFRLTDGPHCKYKDIWTHLSEQGLTVGNFSSMNSKRFEADNSFFFPDPWNQTEKPFPTELSILNDFISGHVQNHTRKSKPQASTVDFLKFYVRHGLSLSTLLTTAKILLKEKTTENQTWRRAFVLDWITLDVFTHLVRTKKPRFATFFSNSTAHMQHAYWRQHEPEAFELKPTDKERAAFGSAVREAYQNHDALLGRLLNLSQKLGYDILLASGLSQQPCAKYDQSGGQLFYRFHDLPKFLTSLGFQPKEILPTMTHQYRVRFNEPGKAAALRDVLNSIKQPHKENSLFYLKLDDEYSLYLSCGITYAIDLHEKTMIESKETPLNTLFYRIDDMKSGMHHPEGIAWFSWPAKSNKAKLELMDIAPILCDRLNVPDLVGQANEHTKGATENSTATGQLQYT